MAMAEADDGDLYAAFGDDREEALEKLEEVFPSDKRLSALEVGEGEPLKERFRERLKELDAADHPTPDEEAESDE